MAMPIVGARIGGDAPAESEDRQVAGAPAWRCQAGDDGEQHTHEEEVADGGDCTRCDVCREGVRDGIPRRARSPRVRYPTRSCVGRDQERNGGAAHDRRCHDHRERRRHEQDSEGPGLLTAFDQAERESDRRLEVDHGEAGLNSEQDEQPAVTPRQIAPQGGRASAGIGARAGMPPTSGGTARSTIRAQPRQLDGVGDEQPAQVDTGEQGRQYAGGNGRPGQRSRHHPVGGRLVSSRTWSAIERLARWLVDLEAEPEREHRCNGGGGGRGPGQRELRHGTAGQAEHHRRTPPAGLGQSATEQSRGDGGQPEPGEHRARGGRGPAVLLGQQQGKERKRERPEPVDGSSHHEDPDDVR